MIQYHFNIAGRPCQKIKIQNVNLQIVRFYSLLKVGWIFQVPQQKRYEGIIICARLMYLQFHSLQQITVTSTLS